MNFGPDPYFLHENDQPDHVPMSYCPACGTIGYEGEEYCFFCGHGLSTLGGDPEGEGGRRCTNCNARLPHPVACYCGRCGAPIEER